MSCDLFTGGRSSGPFAVGPYVFIGLGELVALV